jgi:PAS domain S-box-containing protein
MSNSKKTEKKGDDFFNNLSKELKDNFIKLRGIDINTDNPNNLTTQEILNSSMGIYIVKDGKFKIVNAQCEHLTGYSKSELLGKEHLELVLPEDRGWIKNNSDEILVKDNSIPYEYRIQNKNGETIWLVEMATPIEYEGGHAVLGNFMDITDCKSAEYELGESEEKFKLLFEESNEGILYLDSKGNIIDVNPKALKMAACTKKEIKDKHFLDLIGLFNLDVEALMDAFDDMLLDLTPTKAEWKMQNKHGEQLTILAHPSLIKKEGKTVGISVILEDITEQKRAEEAQRESDKRYRTLFEASPTSITLLDISGVIIDCNNSTEKLIGYSKDEIIGQHFEKLMTLDQQDLPKVKAKLFKLLEGEDIKPYELNIIRKDGKKRWINIINSLILKDNEIAGFQVIAKDITARKKAEDRLKQSLKEKEVLLQEVHHRVKNNMQIISSLLKLQSRQIKNKKAVEMFKDSQQRIKSMALVHERLYRSDDLASIDFKAYVNALVKDLFRSYKNNNGNVKFNVAVKNVSLGIDYAIPCGLIISELVSNSLKYAFPKDFNNSKQNEINIKLCSRGKNEIELTVSDNGVGIPPDLNYKKTKSLGLHLVNLLVEDQFQGNLKLSRAKGTNFQIRFKVG